jgi:chlorobactene glucosyltransferase
MAVTLFIVLATIHLFILSIVIYNFISAPKILNAPVNTQNGEKTSILIPVRNEEKNIGKLLNSLLAQSYTNYEIIVLDDGSTDNSQQVIEEYMEKTSRIKLIKGSELPDNWLGKNWACYQLSKHANYNLLLFIDADVVIGKNALAYSCSLIEKYNLDMISVFPTQITDSLGERLVVPLMNWLLLTFLPLKQVYKSNNRSFSAANGQFILIKKDIYEGIGTHENFKENVVEDMEIIRSVKENGKRGMTCLGNGVICAEMYSSLRDSINGFSKNFFAGFNTSRWIFLFLLILFIILFFLPIVLVAWSGIYLILVGIIIIERILVSTLSKENIFYNIMLHPFQILIMFMIGLKSLSRKKKVWKGRVI